MPQDHQRAAADRKLALRARGDLESIEVAFGGQSSFVVKDPVTGEAFHLTAAEHSLLLALRQPTSLRELERRLAREFAPRRATIAELQQFVNRLYDQGLLVGDAPGQGAELLARGVQRRRRRRLLGLLSVLSIRIGRFNPAPLVEKLHAALGWLLRPPALLAAACLGVYAVVLVLAQAEQITARLPSLAALAEPRRLPLWIAAIAGVKVLHELGHALACRRLGARPQEMGVLLMAGIPALYCDVSDAWRLPSKWRRMAVSGAGMGVELALAAIATIVWTYAAPGLLSALCLSVIVVCSVGTLAVNANPLLRYDGYYLLADWLEVPNLAERARGLIAGTWRRWLLGERPAPDPFVTAPQRRALWLYALASAAYVAAVLAAVFLIGLKLARPHDLQNLVYAVAAIVLAGVALRPALALAALAANPGLRMRLRWLRVAGTGALAAILACAAWFWPMTRHVWAPLVLAAAPQHPLYAAAAGELQFAAPAGTHVQAGDIVVRLANPELELELARQQGVVQERRLRVAHLRTLQGALPAAATLLPTAAAELADAEAQLVEQQRRVDALVIRAPSSGRLLDPPPRTDARRGRETLRTWTGSPLDERNLGAWIEPGAALAVVAAPGAWAAWAGVAEDDVPAITQGQAARVVVDAVFSAEPGAILDAEVVQVSRQARDNHPEPGADRDRVRDQGLMGDDRYHVVELHVAAPVGKLFAGARGTAKIVAEQSTLGAIAWQHVQRTFSKIFSGPLERRGEPRPTYGIKNTSPVTTSPSTVAAVGSHTRSMWCQRRGARLPAR
ncbi:MAG TPA: HlyD family efflux transporter periplasmic adaptor subunit [Lacipirellulaceae bacterium]|nr:HlyD family efflux transporter periplasmic adaptor subunit [Lacipirellulaceae bacterium]